jgi:DNA polymerase III subunit beta
MQIRMEQRVLLQALWRAQGIIDKKANLNVLAHVLIESVGKDAVRVSCTDYDVGLIATYPAEVIEEGAMTLSGKNSFDVIKSLPNAPVRLERQPNHWVTVECGRSTFRLAGIPAEDFPEQKEPEDFTGFTVDKGTLLRLIDRTIFSVSMDESRMTLNGVYFRADPVPEGGGMRLAMVSTDGHRLSRVLTEVMSPVSLSTPIDAIVHRKGVNELKRILEGEDVSVEVATHQNNIIFRYGNAVLLVRQIEDSFPEYEKVIPKSSKIAVEIAKQELLEGVRQTSTLNSSKVSVVRFGLEKGRAVLSTTNPEQGEARVEIDIEYDGEEVAVGFNHRYLLDVLQVISGPQVTFKLNDEFSPGILESDEDPGATFVIMPMRI